MNYLSSIVNKKYNNFHHNKILLNIPVTRNLPHQKFFNYYSSTERKNNQKFNDYQLNNYPYLISNENSLESKKLFHYKKFNIVESLNEDPIITNIKLQFKNLEGKIDKIRKIVSNSNSQKKNDCNNKNRNVFPIQQIKYETYSKYNNIPISNNYNEILNSNYNNEINKSNKRIVNRSNHNFDISKIKNNLNKFIKNSFLKYNKTPKKPKNNDSSDLSQLANDIIRTFEVDNTKYKGGSVNDNKINNKSFKYSVDNKLNYGKEKNNNNVKRNNYLSDNIEIIKKKPDKLFSIVSNNNLYFGPQKKVNKDKIFKKEIKNKKIIKFLEKENKKLEKNKINENNINDNFVNQIKTLNKEKKK